MGDALKRVVSRAISDAAFRRHLQTDPRAALKEFDLSAAEISAITSGDATKLTALGIDQRMSRMFAVDPGGVGTGAVSRFDSDAAAYAARIDDSAAGASLGHAAANASVASDAAGAGLGAVDPSSAGGHLDRVDVSPGASDNAILERLDTDPSGATLDRIDAETGGFAGLGSHDDGAGSGTVDAHDLDGGGLPQGGAETPNDV